MSLTDNQTKIQALLDAIKAMPDAITIDSTLTQSGQAADAKATGDALTATVKSVNGIYPDSDGDVEVLTIGNSNSANSGSIKINPLDYVAMIGIQTSGQYSSTDTTSMNFALRMDKDSGLISAAVTSKSGSKYPTFYTTVNPPTLTDVSGTLDVSKGGTGVTSFNDTTPSTERYRASALVAAGSEYISSTNNGVITWEYE